MKKILLIKPPIGSKKENISLPLNLIILGTYLSNMGIQVQIIDLELLIKQGELSDNTNFYQEAAAYIKQFNVNLIGITSMCSNMPISVKLAQQLKKIIPNSYIIMGGPEPSVMSEELLGNYKEIDMIVSGEGERALYEIVESYYDDNITQLQNILGTSLHLQNKVKINPARELIKCLDDETLPKYSLVNMQNYIDAGLKCIPILAGSGCVFNCIFCSTTKMWKRKFRAKSANRLIAEMDAIFHSYKMNRFDLVHDLFTLDRNKLLLFCEAVKKRNYIWGCSSRIDTIDPELMQIMKHSGCESIFYGIESASSTTQHFIGKKIELEKIDHVFTSSINEGIDSIASFIIGFPLETGSQIDQTLSYAIDTVIKGASRTNVHLLSPLSKTTIAQKYDIIFSEDILEDSDHLPIDDADAMKQIKKKSNIYTSFYRVKNKYHSNKELISITKMTTHLTNYFPYTTSLVSG